jgi:uncharacterized tellurite resistance protein B-like protein
MVEVVMLNTAFDDSTAGIFSKFAHVLTTPSFEDLFKTLESAPARVYDWTVPEAFIGILIGAALADGEVHQNERDEIIGLRKRTRILQHLSDDQVSKANQTVIQRFSERGDKALEQCCGALPTELRLPIFSLCVDITLADGKLHRNELLFLKRVADLLGIDAACPSSDEMGHFDDLRSEVLAHLV